MAELRLTLDLRLPPDPAVIAPVWAAAGIKHSPPEVCRMLLLAQLAAPLDETGWQGAALIVGAALEAVAPEREAEAAEPQAEPAESAAYAEMAAAFARPGPLGDAPADPELILIEDDAPAEGGGVAQAPEPMAEAAPAVEPKAAPELVAEPSPEVVPEPEPMADAPTAPDWLDLIDRVEAGESIASVVRSTGVDARTLGAKVTARRPLLYPAGPAPAAIPDPEPAPAEPAPAPVPVEPEDEDVQASPEDGDAWTSRLDLKLATLMFAGNGIKHASLKLGRSKEDCIQRYRDLMPRPGSAAQAALVKRLRAQVEAEGGDA